MTSAPSVAVAVLAAGSGSRFESTVNKAYLPLDDVAMVVWSLRRAASLDNLVSLLLVIAEADRATARTVLREYDLESRVEIVAGGATRHASEWAALAALESRISAGEIDIVAIHDGARPYADLNLFQQVIAQADAHGGAIPGRAQPAVVAVDPDDDLTGDLITVQTPQAFRAPELLAAYRRASTEGFEGTDTASTVERFCDLEVVVVTGPAANLKVTYPSDLVPPAERRT